MYQGPPPQCIEDLLALANCGVRTPAATHYSSAYSPPLSALRRRGAARHDAGNYHDDDDDAAELALTERATWMRPVPSPSGSPRFDRERDRAPPMPVPAPGGARGVELAPPPVCASDHYEERRRLLGEPGGQEQCFACCFARNDTMAPAAQPGVRAIEQLLRSQSAGANKVALAGEIEQLFEREVRRVINRTRLPDEPECPPWPAADIYEHYFTSNHGRVDANASAEKRATALEQMFDNINDFLLFQLVETADGRQVKVVKPDMVRLQLQVNQALQQSYAKRPKELAAAASANVGRAPSAIARRTFGALPGHHLAP